MAQVVRSVKNAFIGVATAYNNMALKSPKMTGIVTTVLKTSAADAFTQKFIEGKEQMNYKRNLVFTSFGFAYLGIWQFHLYNKIFVSWTPTLTSYVGRNGASAVLTFFDQCIHHPLMYFPCFYALQGTIEGRPLLESVKRSQDDMWVNLQALWKVWVPCQLVNFAIVPIHLRVPYVAAVSAIWCVVLSTMRGTMDHLHEANEDAQTCDVGAGVSGMPAPAM
eukprot:gene16038-22176_t